MSLRRNRYVAGKPDWGFHPDPIRLSLFGGLSRDCGGSHPRVDRVYADRLDLAHYLLYDPYPTHQRRFFAKDEFDGGSLDHSLTETSDQ